MAPYLFHIFHPCIASKKYEFLISCTTDGVAVLLTIFTMLSTPILTCIFGDGSLEVNWQGFIQNTRKSLLSVLNQGEDTEDWAHYEEPAVVEVTG